MRESRLSGSVEGVMSNHDPYSDSPSPLVGLRLQSLLGHGSRHCLWNHFTHHPDCYSPPGGQRHPHRRRWNLLSLGSFSHDPNGSLAEVFLMTLLHMAQQFLAEPFVCQLSRRITF